MNLMGTRNMIRDPPVPKFRKFAENILQLLCSLQLLGFRYKVKYLILTKLWLHELLMLHFVDISDKKQLPRSLKNTMGRLRVGCQATSQDLVLDTTTLAQNRLRGKFTELRPLNIQLNSVFNIQHILLRYVFR